MSHNTATPKSTSKTVEKIKKRAKLKKENEAQGTDPQITVVDKPIRPKKDPLKTSINKSIRSQADKNALSENWEKFDNILSSCKDAIIQMGATVNQVTSTHGFRHYATNIARANLLVQGLENDLKTFSNELMEISKRHYGRKGLINTENALIEAVHIHEDYSLWYERFNSVTQPIIQELMTQAQEAGDHEMRDQMKRQLEEASSTVSTTDESEVTH